MDSDELIPPRPEVIPSVPFYPTTTPEHVQREQERRERIRAEELEHLTDLRDRVQEGIDHGAIDVLAGTEMLLNISKARMALSGVGMYPAF